MLKNKTKTKQTNKNAFEWDIANKRGKFRGRALLQAANKQLYYKQTMGKNSLS